MLSLESHKLDVAGYDALDEERDLAVRLVCPECKDPHPNVEVEFSAGDVVCRDCGLVLMGRIVDTRPQCMSKGDMADRR